MINWSQESVEKVAKAISGCFPDNHWADWKLEAKAALAVVAELPEVKALVEAADEALTIAESQDKIPKWGAKLLLAMHPFNPSTPTK